MQGGQGNIFQLSKQAAEQLASEVNMSSSNGDVALQYCLVLIGTNKD